MSSRLVRALCTFALATPLPLAAQAAGGVQPEVLLWPAGAPGARGSTPEDQPSVTPVLPAPGQATGAAALVFAGGGYGHIAVDKEGMPTARWLASLGVTAFVVRYRLGPAYHHPAMLQDAQRAMRLVRTRAATWHLDPARIGVVGFSAGGHLASTVSTQPGEGAAGSADVIERASARPDFQVLIYPVITMRAPNAHAGSRTRLLGEQPADSLVARLSSETQVTRDTPPAFVVASTDDRTVPVENALAYYGALKAAGVPAELHVYESGRHGFGLAPDDPALSTWLTVCAAWLRRHGWLERAR